MFQNYQTVRETLEREHWQQYEEQLRRTREQAAREQHKEQQQKTAWGQRQADTGSRTQQQAPKGEKIPLPQTPEEAYAILSLKPPVTLAEVKRAYRTKAREYHPDHGGSHAQMVLINAAFELIQQVVA